ncbi:MAG: hypothetical protein CL609_15150 [Anaerolineaceae bacterium]|nr:hypothetical protein [Anaerolineaceae bacterium]
MLLKAHGTKNHGVFCFQHEKVYLKIEIRILTTETPKVGQPVIGVIRDENGSERTIKLSPICSIQELS